MAPTTSHLIRPSSDPECHRLGVLGFPWPCPSGRYLVHIIYLTVGRRGPGRERHNKNITSHAPHHLDYNVGSEPRKPAPNAVAPTYFPPGHFTKEDKRNQKVKPCGLKSGRKPFRLPSHRAGREGAFDTGAVQRCRTICTSKQWIGCQWGNPTA